MHVLDVVDLWIRLQTHLIERAVETLKGVATHLLERRREPGHRFERGPRPRMLVVVEGERPVGVMNRDDASAKPTLGLRGRGARLALDGIRVDVLAGEALDCRDQIGGNALWDERVALA